MLKTIVYEHPLNERVRSFMRLEQLFTQTYELINSNSYNYARFTMISLSEILEILNRPDIKTDILKELERNQIYLAKLSNTPGVNTKTLHATLDELEKSYQNIRNIEGQFGQVLREHQILAGLVKRSSLVGGICSFDLPIFHYWLNSDPTTQHNQVSKLYQSISNIHYAIKLLLSIIRESSIIQNKVAENGFFQQNLNSTHPYQMIRVLIPCNVDYFAEISGGKHRFSIYFLSTKNEINDKAKQINDNIPFQLGCCAV